MVDILINGQIYLLLFLYLLMMVWLESSKFLSRYKSAFLLISSVILIFFIGCRWETGTDWMPYKTLFDSLELDWTFVLNVYHFELGYVLFNAFVRFFTQNYTIFLLINAGITIGLMSCLIKKVTFYPNISLLLFYSNFCIAHFLGSNRRMMAMVFVLWMFYFFSKNELKKGYISLGAAVLFHKSSLVTLIGKRIGKDIWPGKKIVRLLIISLIVGILGIPQLMLDWVLEWTHIIPGFEIIDQLELYSNDGVDHIQTGTGNIIVSSVLAIFKRGFFLVFYYNIIEKNNVDDMTRYFFNIYVISISGYLIFVGSFFQMLTTYFTFIEVLLIGRLFRYTTKNQKLLFCFFIGFFALVQISNALNVYPDLYLPYKNILCQ